MSTPFSTPFLPASPADWLAQVQKDLKAPAIYEQLRWPSPEGFVVEPYYTQTDLTALPLSMLQTAQRTTPGWLNTPAYDVQAGTEKATNATLREALLTGADALMLHLPGGVNLTILLNGIKLSDTPVFFQPKSDVVTFLTALRQLTPYQIRGGLLSGTLADQLTVNALTDDSPNFRPFVIDGSVYHNAGATATQELAFTLAHLTDTYDELTDAGLNVGQLALKTMLSMAVGTSYFMEIAKLRALRVLWQRLMGHYGVAPVPAPFIYVTTSPFHEAAATPYTNLLRATTGAMAAVLGGADALTVRPYDAVSGTSGSTGFSQRIARNVAVLLREESYFGKVADPSAGSYYIETLTHQLVESAWALFLQVEQMGGLAKASESGSIHSGYVQRELYASYEAKVKAVKEGRVLVGVTKFRHDEAGTVEPVSREADLLGQHLTDSGSRRIAAAFE